MPTPPAPDRRTFVLPLALLAALCAADRAPGQVPDLVQSDHVMEGWRVFVQKQCIHCHAVWGLGGEVGPDLGRSGKRLTTSGQLAGIMWNHIPKMYSHMLRKRHEYPNLSREEMGDLFSFLLFVQYLDEPGDPVAGRRALHEKGCAKCHSLGAGLDQSAPDLRRWADYVNPIVWAHKMWEHAPRMEQAMQQAGMTWPELDDDDLVNIIAYVRSVGGREAKMYLEPGSAKNGAVRFAERQCSTCHHPRGVGHDLATVDLPQSLAALASRMWNHSPQMTRVMEARGVERSPLSAQEMSDIIAYIISLRSRDRGGDARRGRAVFEAKRCSQCHTETGPGGEDGPPDLDVLGASGSPVGLAHAMWNHGVTMMDLMSDAGTTWPVFQRDEIVDLIAYLDSLAPPKAAPSGAVETAAPIAAVQAPVVNLPPIEAGASCVSNACHPGIVAGRMVHTPAAQGECGACHASVDAQTHQFKLTSSGSDLCYQCHDEPVETMRSHGPIDAGVCTACHNPHSADNLFGPNFTGDELCFADMIGAAAALETLVGDEGKVVTEPVSKPVTEPVGASEPAPPVAPPPERPGLAPHLATPDADPAAIAAAMLGITNGQDSSVPPPTRLQGGCATSDCHATLVVGAFVHGPVAQQQCLSCHVVVDEQAHRFALAGKEPDLCYQCHEKPAESPFVHGPVALGMCSACHDPHSAPNQYMLPEAGPELCFMCHTEMGEHVHNARVKHEVIDKEGCLACHDPHRGSVRLQLRKEVPELCYDCHEPIREIVSGAVVAHDPVSTEKKCINCHNPHGSDVPKILSDTEINLCLGCHDRPMDTPHGTIIDMKSWIEDNPERHGPIRDESCTGCHQPHGSKNFRILKHAFPRKFYHEFSVEVYDLCFECHEETLVLDERTTTLTDFRNGDKNLHYIHVNQKKGRTCRACHEVHAGTKPKRIKDFVPFGNWKYPVNFEKTEQGGSCAPGCHVERAYDRTREILQK